jgi:competence protein ComEC
MLVLYLLDLAGFSWIRGNPLPEDLQMWIRNADSVTVSGEVADYTDDGSSCTIYLKNTYLTYFSDKISIKNILVYTNEIGNLSVGDHLKLSGSLKKTEGARNPGGFDAKTYYACRHIYYTMRRPELLEQSQCTFSFRGLIYCLRQNCSAVLDETAGDDAPFFKAMLLGDKSDLDEEIKLRFSQAGMLHILTISGLHIGMIGTALYEVLLHTGLGMIPSGFLSFFLMLFYGILTGNGAATVRAIVMFVLAVGGRMLGRSYDTLTALAVSAMLLLADSTAWLFSSSFLFSFAAVLGMAVVSPVLKAFFDAERGVAAQLLTTVGIQVSMLPFLFYFNGEVSVTGILVNLFVVPTAACVLFSGCACMAVGSFWKIGGQILALPGRFLLGIYQWISRMACKIPGCTWIAGRPSIEQMYLYGVLTATFLFLLWNLARRRKEKTDVGYLTGGKKKRSVRQEKWEECYSVVGRLLICLCTLGFSVWVLTFDSLNRPLITCLDVGQGDGCVVQIPSGGCFLVDCGSSSQSNPGKYTLIPYLKNQGISFVDAVFVSHTDTDHISGILELLDEISEELVGIRAGALVLPRWANEPEAMQTLITKARSAGMEILKVSAGDGFAIGDVQLSVLSPGKDADGSDTNAQSMVLKLTYGEFQALFTGDIDAAAEESLADQLETIDFLKVAHHGSRYSSSQIFLNQIRPALGVISCSENNRYGHPAKESVERLESVGCSLLYTMQSGAVSIYTDGEEIVAEVCVTDDG